MRGAFFAGGLRLSVAAAVEPALGILQQLAAIVAQTIVAQLRVAMPPATVERDQMPDGRLFIFYPPHRST
jgi:hypothetical protein